MAGFQVRTICRPPIMNLTLWPFLCVKKACPPPPLVSRHENGALILFVQHCSFFSQVQLLLSPSRGICSSPEWHVHLQRHHLRTFVEIARLPATECWRVRNIDSWRRKSKWVGLLVFRQGLATCRWIVCAHSSFCSLSGVQDDERTPILRDLGPAYT